MVGTDRKLYFNNKNRSRDLTRLYKKYRDSRIGGSSPFFYLVLSLNN